MTNYSRQKSTQPNLLVHEKSPYLLQHAYNPVNWYGWGEEAFQKAAVENKPIFLSIGYSTCHWCHVMARESFENEAIAEILNTSFISIKVDREERPDIDQIYMIATQAMTGGGGWPMSVFMFPDKKPFYAGTYFPPEARYNHPGFPELLRSIAKAWVENKEALTGSAEKITEYLRNSSSLSAAQELTQSWSDKGYYALTESYDTAFHGFGSGNKFPRPVSLDFLHRYAHRTGNPAALKMSEETLKSMAAGGMYDHIGGGFHRYSVDPQWRIPHFEKMLYDQAQLITTYLHMYQETGHKNYSEVAQETLEYILRDMQHPEGALYSAEDADSVNPYNEQEHSEGAFYLWKESEIRELLDQHDAEIFITHFGIQANGNALQDPAEEFTGRNILYQAYSIKEVAQRCNLTHDNVMNSLKNSKKLLLERRTGRIRPHLDDKIITAWNGLMISALAKAGQVLGKKRYLAEAERVTYFLNENLLIDGVLKRRWREGEARFDGVLEDYAFFIQGLLDLYSATHKHKYLKNAIELSEKQLDLFCDSAGGFYSSVASADLLTRMKESYDGAEPSGNSVSALNFIRLGRLINKPEWIEIGEKTIKAFGSIIEAHGSAMPLLLCALELCLSPPKQLVICGEKSSDDTQKLLRQASRSFNPSLQILLADGSDNQQFLSQYLDFIATVEAIEDKATAYLCRNFTCGLPTHDAAELAKLLTTHKEE